MGISKLLSNILRAKGLEDHHIEALEESGINTKEDFALVGDHQTLTDITGLEEKVSKKVMVWAVGLAPATKPEEVEQVSSSPIVVESSDIVKCVHCNAKQPNDYKTGDLCLSCGNQAEPVQNCHWCLSSGPGKYCRSCGSEFVGSSDFEIALYLKREGESKRAIVAKVKDMDSQEKENMWAKIRRAR
ncbi:hypothetical protein ABWH96_17870 [Marivirga tractuosa]|uniref:hypothetical protein n=1 Tax=Marivirga tractuosa TaxID=1006 RepID=UPI0035CE8B48